MLACEQVTNSCHLLTMCLSTWLKTCLQYCGLRTELAVEIEILLTSHHWCLVYRICKSANIQSGWASSWFKSLNLGLVSFSALFVYCEIKHFSRVCISTVCVITNVMLGSSVPSWYAEAKTIQQGINVSSTSNRALRQLPQAALWNRQVDGHTWVCLNCILDMKALLLSLYLTWRHSVFCCLSW